ncbi:MAG: DUF4900 domain-containing protein [Candidatus Omnitrophota bacterium]
MFIKNQRGAALAISLMVIIVLIILGSVLILRSVTEKRSSDEERRTIQAFYLAEAGANSGLDRLDYLINTDLLTAVTQINPQTLARRVSQYVAGGDGLGFLRTYVKEYDQAQFTLSGDGLSIYHNGTTTALGSGNYIYTIYVREKSNPYAVATDTWDFPYTFTINALGTSSTARRRVLLTGDFTVRVQKDNFARYALFTNHHSMPSGTTVWFTNNTNFSGPLHTNERYSFAYNPSGTFDGMVTQHILTARYFNGGSPVLRAADSNPPYDVPIFNADFIRGANEINLESSVTQQDLMDQARAGDRSAVGNGIYLANNGTALTGGIFVKGDSTVQMTTDTNGDAKYIVTQGTTTKNITVKKNEMKTNVETVGGGTVTYDGIPDGMDDLGTIIYVDGAVTGLKGTVQKDTEVTVSSQNDIIITDNLVYQETNPGPPLNAEGKTNLLGIVCWGGNVRIGPTAPNNVNIHGTIMARNGIFTVDGYDSGDPRGTATLLGGVITNFYGAFGQFNSQTGQMVHGYARNYVYDERMSYGNAPPYFPSMNTFIAFSDDITDKINWQEGGI